MRIEPPGRQGFFGWVSRHPRRSLLVALVVGIGAGVAVSVIGGGPSGDEPAALGEAKAELKEERADREVAEQKLRETRDALEATEGRPEPPPKRPELAPEPPGDEEEEQTFSGNGGKILGTITIPTESMLEWTNDGNTFQIFSTDEVPVNSQAKRGETALAKGVYKKFQVNAVGNWTVKIKPR